jgi:pimeloyl-ACP methyl ester carboxylesterase
VASSLVCDGLRVHYDVAGSGDVGALFAHGLTGTGAADWRLMLPVLTPHYRCVVPDLRGHGRSDYRAAGFSVDAMGEDVRALIAHERMERPHLVGFSMGAELLLSLELEEPGTARGLVLIGPSTGCPPDRGGYGVITGEAPSFWPKLLRRLHDEHHGLDHWRTLFRHIAGSWGERPEASVEQLATLRCPILIVQGEDEVPYKKRQVKALVEAAPDARLEVLSGADHPVHVQRADAVNALVRDFLLDVDQRLVAKSGRE